MTKFYLIITIVIVLTVLAIFVWNLIINAEEKREENKMYDAARKNPGNTICAYCKLYANSKHGYCFYAGESTSLRNRCNYFMEKKGGKE